MRLVAAGGLCSDPAALLHHVHGPHSAALACPTGLAPRHVTPPPTSPPTPSPATAWLVDQANPGLLLVDLRGNEVTAVGVKAMVEVLSRPECGLQVRNRQVAAAYSWWLVWSPLAAVHWSSCCLLVCGLYNDQVVHGCFMALNHGWQWWQRWRWWGHAATYVQRQAYAAARAIV